jgi:hypothetical protein
VIQKQNTSLQWKSPEFSKPKRVMKSQNHIDLFSCIKVIIHYDFVFTKQIVNQAFYLEALECLQKRIIQKGQNI